MACRIATTRTTRLSYFCSGVIISAVIGLASAQAEGPPPPAPPVPDSGASLISKACETGTTATADEAPLPNVAAALAQRKSLRILAMGAAPGRLGVRRRLHGADRGDA